MQHLSFRPLFAAALVSSILTSAGCSSVFGGLATPPAKPPQAERPCDLPFKEKAQALPPQAGIDQPLAGPDIVQLWKGDIAEYNGLVPRHNANIDYAGEQCIARPAPPPAKAAPPRRWWQF